MIKKILQKVFLIILLAIFFGVGFWFGQNNRPSIEKVEGVFNKETIKPGSVDFSLFWDAWAKVQEKYVNRSSLDYQKMVYGAISGMVESLGDPYTIFMPPPETKKFSEDIKGSFGGIGAEIGIRKGVLTIVSPLENSPSKKAGLQAGDQIIKIDGKSTENLSLDEGVSMIRGEKGTQVTLSIFRESFSEPKDYKVTRDTIEVPTINYDIKSIGENGKKIAYVQIFQFSEKTAEDFKKIVSKILESPAEGIIVDLRNNPGGYLEVAVDIASWFLDRGELVVSEDFGNGNKNEHRSYGYIKLKKYQVAVLINQGSASASEILAGALRDDRNFKLIGEKSFGKGSVQQLENLKGGSSLKITVAKWLTPSGHSIMEDGLEPNEKIGLTEDDFNNNRDPQLEKALEVLK